jgi:hypothetical protein
VLWRSMMHCCRSSRSAAASMIYHGANGPHNGAGASRARFEVCNRLLSSWTITGVVSSPSQLGVWDGWLLCCQQPTSSLPLAPLLPCSPPASCSPALDLIRPRSFCLLWPNNPPFSSHHHHIDLLSHPPPSTTPLSLFLSLSCRPHPLSLE